MVSSRGWELMQWTYWFDGSNREWGLSNVENSPTDDTLKILIAEAEEDSPIRAVEWLIERSGCRILDKEVAYDPDLNYLKP